MTSKLIKDFTDSTLTNENALKKLKVLFYKLNNQELTNWVKYELEGYPKGVDVPDYRKVKGILTADYLIYTPAGLTRQSNQHIFLPNTDAGKKLENELLYSYVKQSTQSLRAIVDSKQTTIRPQPQTLYDAIATLSGLNITINHLATNFDYTVTGDILAKVEGRILDTFLLLETEFGNLDNLDIDLQSKDANETKSIIQSIQIMLLDNSTTIGNSNEINDSNLLNSIGGSNGKE